MLSDHRKNFLDIPYVTLNINTYFCQQQTYVKQLFTFKGVRNLTKTKLPFSYYFQKLQLILSNVGDAKIFSGFYKLKIATNA